MFIKKKELKTERCFADKENGSEGDTAQKNANQQTML